MLSAGTANFEMTKKHHGHTFERALREQKADPKIVSLCRFINTQPSFFSASSCSGRIVLLELNKNETKRESAFVFKKHSQVTAIQIQNALQQKTRFTIWFKQEPFILHLGADSLENSNRLLSCARKAGVKRAGIMVAKPNKFMLEIIGTHGLSVPLKQKKRILITMPFLKKLVSIANRKLANNFKRLKRFEATLRNELEKRDE